MNEKTIRQGSLVLYKKHPARVLKRSDKLEIELGGGKQVKVRPKDVVLLHPGPLQGLDELTPQEGEVLPAWELMSEGGEGEIYDLAELADLIYGEYTPTTAWAAWQWLEDGLYFRGSLTAVVANSADEVAREQESRQARAAEAQAWETFLERARQGAISPQEDARYLRETEDVALDRREDSRLLHALGRAQRPQVAHAFLLEVGCWDETLDPHPARLGLTLTPPELSVPTLPDEGRQDLSHLPALAIDDRGNRDPDDALSLEKCELDDQGNFLGGRLWVHIADAAALAPPGSPIDLDARARAATLYLPEGQIPMLPREVVDALGLGLQERSPALSFGLVLDQKAELVDIQVQPSWVRVQRLTYDDADQLIEDEPLAGLYQIAQAYQARRRREGALFIDLPEAIVRVVDGEVVIRPVERLRSRDLVREAMLMVGEAAARFAVEHTIAFPFVIQDPPDERTSAAGGEPPSAAEEGSLAAHFAVRRTLKRSQVSGHPGAHAGVGLSFYSRATSPLRRYLDLAAHQQLRAFLRGDELLDEGQMLQRLGASEALIGSLNMAERLARRHWTLVYLQRRPGWRGEGVLVDLRGLSGRVIIPELAFETQVHLRQDLPLDSRLTLSLRGVNLPELEAYFDLV